MIRRVLLKLSVVTILLFCSGTLCQEKIKIGFISLKKISDESLKKKAVEEEVEKLLAGKRPDVEAIQKEIQDLETAKALSGPDQAKKDEEKIQEKKRELLKIEREVRQEVARLESAFQKEILNDIEDAVKEIAQEKGYTWVLVDEVLLYRDDSADLTFQTLVKINEKFLKGRSETPTSGAPKGEASSGGKPLPVSAEDALIDDVISRGVRNRQTIKEIQPRKGSASGSITMKGEGDRIRFVSQYPKDMPTGPGSVVSAPMGDKSVWRFVGTVSLSGYKFTGLEENRPLSFILLNEIGLAHLYGRGSVTYPDGHSVAIEEQQPVSPAKEGEGS
jgi:Skp family chaperone for outer membrane proteins